MDTGFDRVTISQNSTLGALPVGAENSQRSSVPVMVAENADTIGEQSGSNRLALK
jgi:hypothetical protein